MTFVLNEGEKLLRELQRMDFLDKPNIDKKPLQLLANSLGVNLDQPIHRVFTLDHLLHDLENKTFTFMQINKNTWNALEENPLKNKAFQLETGEIGNINMDDYYGSCWSRIESSTESFKLFGDSPYSLRVTSTVGKILSEVMNLNNTFYSLHYFVGAIRYAEQRSMDWELENKGLYDHLDSRGLGLILSLLVLPNKYIAEKEIRFLFLYQPQVEWIKTNVNCEEVRGVNICRHPFDWDNIIDHIELSPHCSTKQAEEINNLINCHGIL